MFWTPGLPEGVLSNRPCPLVRPLVRPWSVRGPSVFRYLRDCSLVFSNFGPQVLPKGSLVIALVRVCPSVFKYLRDCSLVFSSFGPRVYPKGSLVIALVHVSVHVCVHPSVFKYLRDRSFIFSETLLSRL